MSPFPRLRPRYPIVFLPLSIALLQSSSPAAVTYAGYTTATRLGTDVLFFSNWGYLTVDGGSQHTLDNFEVGAHSSGSLLVSGANSSLNINGWFLIGVYDSQGHTTIEKGGKIIIQGGATIGLDGDVTAPHTLTVDGTNSKFIAGRLTVGNAGAGRINLANDAALEITYDSRIGKELDFAGDIFTPAKIGFGEVTVGHNTTFTTGGTLYVGNETGSGPTWEAADGHLHIYPGSLVEAGNIIRHPNRGHINWHGGTIRVKGGDTSALHDVSGNLYLGSSDGQTLELHDQATPTATRIVIGNLTDQEAKITITGEAERPSYPYEETSLTSTSHCDIGASGKGTLQLANGWMNVQGTYLTLGAGSSAEGNLWGDGSQAIVSHTASNAELTIGSEGSGSMILTNGASASTQSSYLGRHPGSFGYALLQKSTWNSAQTLEIGGGGQGRIDLWQDAVLTSNGASIDSTSSLSSHVKFSETKAHWRNTGKLDIGKNGHGGLIDIRGNGTLDNSGAIITVYNHGIIKNYHGSVSADHLYIRPGATLMNHSNIHCLVTNQGKITSEDYRTRGAFHDNVNNEGKISGNLQFSKSLTLSSSSLFQPRVTGDAIITDYDYFTVTGNLHLGGTLAFAFTGGYVPTAGTSFQFWSAGSTTGQFTTINLPTLPTGLHWHTSELQSSGIIRVGLTPENYAAYSLHHSLSGSATDDDDLDGLLNLFEYLRASNPQLNDPTNAALPFSRREADGSFSFLLASPLGDDVTLEIQVSSTMAADDWQSITSRTGNSPWTGSATVVTTPQPDGVIGLSKVNVHHSSLDPILFFRLKTSLSP